MGWTARVVRSHRLWASVWFCCVAIALTWRAWGGSGPALLLDMPWPDHMQLRDFTHTVLPDGSTVFSASPGVPWMVACTLLSFIVGAAVVQKLLLTGLLVFAGIGMWLLAGSVYGRVRRTHQPSAVYRLFAGTLYTLNPYSIDRLWAGQWRVLAGYALAPVLLWAVLRYTQAPTRRRLLIAAGLYAVYPTISQHWWFMATVCLAPWVAYVVWRAVRHGHQYTVLRRVAAVAGLFTLANGWWLALAFGSHAAYEQLQPTDATYFPVTTTLPGGIVGSVVGLGGFWYHPFSFWAGMDGLWLLFVGGLLVCSSVGWYAMVRHHATATLGKGLLLMAVLATGFVLVSGIPAFQSAVQAIMRHVPGVVGLRETTKLVGLLAFCYALLAPLGLFVVVGRIRVHTLRVTAVAAMGMLLVIMIPALQAAPLQPHTYPATWRQAQEYLQHAGAQKVLVLPYAGYTRVPFAGNTLVASPVQLYFDPVMLTGSSTGNPQLNASRAPSQGALGQLAEDLFAGTAKSYQLHTHGIDYVLLANVSGRLLPVTPVLQQVYNNQDWAIYRSVSTQ